MVTERAGQGLPPNYQIGYISQSYDERNFAMRAFHDRTDYIRVCWKTQFIDRNNVGKLASNNFPDLIVISTGKKITPAILIYTLIPTIRDGFGDVPILVRTDLPEDQENIRKMVQDGIHIIDDRLNFEVMIESVNRIRRGEHVVRYPTGPEETEDYEYWMEEARRESVPPRRERF